MTWAKVGFWLLAGCVVYAYLGYPLLLALAARLRPRRPPGAGPLPRSVSLVLAARNEEAAIGRRLGELTAQLGGSGLAWEIIVASDGSTDGTAAVARQFGKEGVHVLELADNHGKAAALSLGCGLAQNEVLLLTDTRQSWDPAALKLLLENFADPKVGAVSGDLVLERAPGVLAGVGMYWRYEKWLRRLESRVHSMPGATGAISAVRRTLFRPVPPGTILDDVYWPLQVVLQGYRVIHDGRARAYDRLPERLRDEFRRKVRTLSGNFQLLTRLPAALLPWRNPIWLQFLSHKILRLLVPWALLGMLVTSALVAEPVYRAALGCQLACYGIGLFGLWRGPGARLRVASAAASFLVLNGAAWLAFWVWVTGRTRRSWTKVTYRAPPAAVGKLLGSPAQNR